MEDSGARLLIAGRPETEDLAREIVECAGEDPRVLLRLAVLPEEDVPAVIGAADLVALPYDELLNSGAALLALSLDRPVLVPDRGAMADLRLLVGADWVHLFSGALTPERLERALTVAASDPPRAPAPLDAFAPAEVARATLAAYRTLVPERGGRG
jgi:glycosyltransferase involved in cell wall biosynthesis